MSELSLYRVVLDPQHEAKSGHRVLYVVEESLEVAISRSRLYVSRACSDPWTGSQVHAEVVGWILEGAPLGIIAGDNLGDPWERHEPDYDQYWPSEEEARREAAS
jgi:hypothetical protein